METIIIKSAGFIIIILIGILFRKLHIFRKEDGYFVSKLVMNITLPAALISSYKTVEITPVLLLASLWGMAANFILIGIGYLLSRKRSGTDKAFYILNSASYNLGTFATPFVQAFFPAAGVAVVCIFDLGNALMCFGFTYAIAMSVAGLKGGFGWKDAAKALFSSVPFDTYIVLLTVKLLHIQLPDGFYVLTDMISAPNAFLAMLMIGLLFEVKLNKKDVRDMAIILFTRYSLAVILGAVIYFAIPIPEVMKQSLTLVLFAPIASITPVFVDRCGGDPGKAAALNSLCIPFAIVAMTVMTVLFLG